MITLLRVLDKGLLNVGDAILIDDGKTVFPATVKDVINQGSNLEEIVISKTKNRYFLVSLLCHNTSWVKACYKIERGKIFSISNTTLNYDIH